MLQEGQRSNVTDHTLAILDRTRLLILCGACSHVLGYVLEISGFDGCGGTEVIARLVLLDDSWKWEPSFDNIFAWRRTSYAQELIRHGERGRVRREQSLVGRLRLA